MKSHPFTLTSTQLTMNVEERDALGTYKRQLANLAQIAFYQPNKIGMADEFINLALDPKLIGFAGFQMPAYLMLAETIYVCRKTYHPDIHECLVRGREAAHNIQDARFCAKATSRMNAMLQLWWKQTFTFDLVTTVHQLCQNPSSPQFSALHQVGEAYTGREDNSNKLPLPDWLKQANTLESIAQIYQKSVVELQRFNADQGWLINTPLPMGTWLNIPDPGFANLLTSRLSAEILVNSGLSDKERVTLIQSLVPLAAANPTVLDTVLARLLLAAHPNDLAMLERLEMTVKRYLKRESE
jgi:hypothetical protein